MSDNVTELPRCQGTKGDGSPCEKIVKASEPYCYSHDPKSAERRSQAASKAARAKHAAGELSDIKAKLKELADGVLIGEVDRANGSVCAQIYGVLLRAIEAERKIKEAEELEQRLEALEAATQPGLSQRGYRWQHR